MFRYIILLGLFAFAHAQNNNKTVPRPDPITVTPSGAIRGSWMETRRGKIFEAYRGIRYAEPPIGELRFQPPKMVLKYDGEVDGTKEGPACPLPASKEYFVDEDCLMINVYTPRHKSSKLLPVIFYIHAGGFYSMTGRSDLAGPHYLLDRDIVLVTINYRIGTLGFLAMGNKLAPGNNGMKDQVAALRWVQRNIASFGGDPNSVTIAGCSAGSISVMLHMISPMTKGLFHRGISMSASPIGKEPTESVLYDLAVKQAELVKCPTNSSQAIFNCLKTKPWRELGDSLTGFFNFGFDPVGLWKPVVESDFGQERYLVEDPVHAIRGQRIHAVPHIISQTTDEFFWLAYVVLKNETLLKQMNSQWNNLARMSFMLPRQNSTDKLRRLTQAYLGGKPLVDDEATAKGLGQLYGDSIIGYPVHLMANMMALYSKQKVWYCEFAYIGNNSHYEDPVTKKPAGAAHHDDLIYIFTQSYRFPTIPLDSPDSQIVDRMTATWYNFARYGDPNPREDTPDIASLNWPAMTPTDRKYLHFNKEMSIRSNMFENRFKVWEELYPLEKW